MGKKVEINKGPIRDNALKALVKSDLFRHKVERKKKGRGSYNRQAFKNGRDGFFDRSAFLCRLQLYSGLQTASVTAGVIHGSFRRNRIRL